MIPPQPRDDDNDNGVHALGGAGVDVEPAAVRPAEQLGFQMRFEAGKALLALEGTDADDGVTVRRALFEVPDVAFPLDVSGGALRFQSKRLTLRAVELAVTWEALFVADTLARQGLTLVRERSRAGGLEIIVTVEGTAGPVPLRARCIFAPVGEGGVAMVLHELLGFSPLPRRRLELAPALLDALQFPGGLPARAMIRRAEPFRAVFSRLLPLYGWKVPSLGDVRVHEAVLGKGEVVLRAWSGSPPEGWKAARPSKKGPLQEAISLAMFADDLAAVSDDDGRFKLVDRLIDDGRLPSSAVPFAAEVLRGDPRRRADGDDLIVAALKDDDEHLGLLSAWAEADDISPSERARRLLSLSKAADSNDEPWVAGRAALSAARLFSSGNDDDDVDGALAAAAAAVEADPSVAEAGMLLARLMAKKGDLQGALVAGRAAMERAGSGSLIEPAADLEAADVFCIELAAVARAVEGIDAARQLLRRALRQHERPDALVPLVELEIDAGALERAAEGLARLLIVIDAQPGLKKDVELLAARLAEEKGDPTTARAHLLRARELDPADPTVALRLARLAEDAGDLDRAIDALTAVVGDGSDGDGDNSADSDVNGSDALQAACFSAARLYLKRGGDDDARRDGASRARVLLSRLSERRRQDAEVVRADAEARAVLGDPAPLGELLLADADAEADRATRVATRILGAKRVLDAGRVDRAAAALAAAFVDELDDVLDAHAGVAGTGAGAAADVIVEKADVDGLVAAIGEALRGGPDASAHARRDAVQGLGRRLAGAGKPRATMALLAGGDDLVSLEIRADAAKDAGDVDAEIVDRESLAGFGGEGALGHLCRLAVLLAMKDRHGDAADVWARAAAVGTVDVAAWQEAAVKDGAPARVALVVARDDADVTRLQSDVLRAAIPLVDDVVARRRLLASLASRNEEVSDVAGWLESARELPPAEAAAAFIEAGHRNENSAWFLEGIGLLEENGASLEALAALKRVGAIGTNIGADIGGDTGDDANAGSLAQDRRLGERGFALALSLDDAAAIESAAAHLLTRDDVDGDARDDIRRRQVAAHHTAQRYALVTQALTAWLDEKPAHIEPLAQLTDILIAPPHTSGDDGENDALTSACERLARAREAGIGDDARALVISVADAARDRGLDAERAARELLLGFDLDETTRERTQRRLVDLSIRAGHIDRAVFLLHALVKQATDRDAADGVIVGLWQRIADLEESDLKNAAAAAAALQALLRHAPDDGFASQRLLALLLDLGDDEALAVECLRRAQLLPNSQERTDLLLRAADVAVAAGRTADARNTMLRAVRSAPFSQVALDRALDLAKQSQSRRLAIRARLAAATAHTENAPSDAAKQMAEAGGLLAGILRRNRLAIACFKGAHALCQKAGQPADSHARMLVELCRAVGDGAGAVHWIDTLLDGAEGKELARLKEARADVRLTLLGDEDGAIADRREALRIDPAYAGAARALARQLTARGDVRGAIDVERAFVNASADGEVLAIAYARLAHTAYDDLDDPALTAELCRIALSARPDIEVRRLLVRATERLDDASAHFLALEGLRDHSDDAVERLIVGRTLATRRAAAGDVEASITALSAVFNDDGVLAAVDAASQGPGLPEDARFDLVAKDLAHQLASLGRLADAADTLLRGMARVPGGEALSPAHQTLEQAGVWLDDAEPAAKHDNVDKDAGDAKDTLDGDEHPYAARALAVLCDAAEAGGLSDDGETRRARLAEELGQPAIACAALSELISRNLEVSESSRRLAVAAEAAGDARRAIAAWHGHIESLRADDGGREHAYLQLERLGKETGDAAEQRAAWAALFELGTGGDDDRVARAMRCAEDALDREHNEGDAITWLDRARRIRSNAEVRARLYTLANAAQGQEALTLAVLDEMVGEGDAVAPAARLRRAELRLESMGVDGDNALAAVAVDDVLAALAAHGAAADGNDDGGIAATANELLGLAVAQAPAVVAQALATRAGVAGDGDVSDDDLAAGALRAALVDGGGLDDASIDNALVVKLADAAPDPHARPRAAARRQVDDDAAAAVDRLLGLAARRGDSSENVKTRDLVDDAADMAIRAGATVVLPRLDALRPAIRRTPERRDQALTVLRDIEAWPETAQVLEDAVIVADDAGERRRLRLQLVSVLREGVDTTDAHAAAAEHLWQLVGEDEGDREAWGELFECLERLDDSTALAAALGRRAAVLGASPENLEARQLVRRRAEILLGLGKAREGAEALDEVRAVGDDDADLLTLARALRQAIDGGDAAGAASVAFLAAELRHAHRGRDARALLALPADAVATHDDAARAIALVVVAAEDVGEAARAVLSTAWSTAENTARIAELVAVCARMVKGDVSDAALVLRFIEAVAPALSTMGSALALQATDALFADEALCAAAGDTMATALAPAAFARRWRTAGVIAAAVDQGRLRGRAAHAAAFRRAARMADREALAASAAALGIAVGDVAVIDSAAVAASFAAQAMQTTPAREDVVVALVRHGDPRAEAHIATIDDGARAAVATRVAASPVRGRRQRQRLAPRLALAGALDPARAQKELSALAAVAKAESETALQVQALDGLFALRPAEAFELVDRADAADALGAADALHFASAAAAKSDGDTAVRLRRRAIALSLVSGDRDVLGAELLALARNAPPGPDGDALRTEARSTAEAARLNDVVDAILSEAEGQLSSIEDRVAAVLDRAELRLRRKDAIGAFVALRDAADSIGDEGARSVLRARAYHVCAQEALTEQALDVVDDPLARAALLALLGREAEAHQEALALASGEAPAGAAAAWLLADLAQRAGDAAGEEAALGLLANHGAADDGAVIRLVDASRRRGDVDDAAKKALAMAQRGLSEPRVRLLMDCLTDGVAAAVRADAARLLMGADVALVGRPLLIECLEASVNMATSIHDETLVRDARLALARANDSDEGWIALLRSELSTLDDADLALSLKARLTRPVILTGLMAAVAADDDASARLASGLSTLVRSGDAAPVVDISKSAEVSNWRIQEVLAGALEVLGQAKEAAAVLIAACDAGAPRKRTLVRAAELLVESDAAGAAARCLCTLSADDLDEAVLEFCRGVVTRAARDGAMGDASRLAGHIGRLVHSDAGGDAFIALALGLADAAGGETALQTASWRLRQRDVRALALLAHHTLEGSEAQGYFGAFHALRAGVRSFAAHAPADFARIAALAASATAAAPLPPPPQTTLERARRGPRAARQAAWRELAADIAGSADVAGSGDEVQSSRLLIRAGVALADAPLEVRLSVDPALADDAARADAIASAIADVAPERRPRIVADFQRISARAGTTAAQRLAVDAVVGADVAGRPAALVALDRLAVGDAVDVKAIVAGLGRAPSATARAQAAVVLRACGLLDAAAVVDPAGASRAVVADSDATAALREVGAATGLEALGRLRGSQLAGPRGDVEDRIAALATEAGRDDLVAESLLRSVRLLTGRADQAACLIRHARLVLPTHLEQARRSALAAHALAPSSQTAELLLQLAEAKDDPAALDDALRAAADIADVADKAGLIARRAQLLAHRMLRPEDAVDLIDDALALAPAAALFVDKANILDKLLARPRDAALSLLSAVDHNTDDAVARGRLRREAARLLEREGGEESLDLAVTVLCEAAADGDDAALDDAEALARQSSSGTALALVLDLRLRDTEDLSTRRVLVLEQARLLHEQGESMGAVALLEAQAVADPIDLGARLALAEWYQKDRRVLDAALAFESAARIPGLPAIGFGPPAREAASLLAALGDLERAGPLADMAVAANMIDLEVLSVAEAWHRAHDRWLTVDELLGRQLEHIADARREAHVWMERAAIRSERLGDADGAKKALSRVLDLVPDNHRALQMLRADAERTDTWGALRMALFRAVDVNNDKLQQASWLREIASIDADHLHDLKAAEATIERALAIDADDVDTLIVKATLMVKAGRVDGVSAIMSRIEGQARENLPGLLHLVRGDALVLTGDRDAAQAAFRAATEDPETSARAWDRLIDMEDGRPSALPLLDEARRSTLDTARRLTLWRKEMRLQVKLGNDADTAAAQVLGLAPADDDALAIVKDAYVRRRKQKELLPFLTAHARAAADVKDRAARLATVADFCLDELGAESAARTFFEEALALDPEQPQALVRLADIAWASRADERALELLDRISPATWEAAPTDSGERTTAELYLRRARCAYALGHSDVRERLRQVLRVDAAHIAALDVLAKFSLESGDDDGAEHALESLSGAISKGDDPIRLASTLIELANLRMRRGRPKDALPAAERAFDLNPTNGAILETIAEVREAAGRYAESAEAWRRVAAMRSGPDRIAALERRVAALSKADRPKDAVDAWLDLYAETGDPRHKAQASEIARNSGQAELLTRVGATIETARENAADVNDTAQMPVAPGSGGALAIQMRASLDNKDPGHALRLAMAAKEQQPLDEDSTRLGLDAARKLKDFTAFVELSEARLQIATAAVEVGTVALDAGRVARDHLHDDDRAAALLYQAHQADAENVEVRLELTELYARIPRLASHAVTGILQLLRRTPADPRIFALAADLSDGQGQGERADAMRAIQSVLRGTGVPQELMQGHWAEERPTSGIMPLDRDGIAQRLAPTGWGSPLQQLITLLGVHLEVALGGPPPPRGAKPLAQASPRSMSLMERIDRLLPGRQVQIVMADVDRPMVCPGGVPQVVVPRDVILNDGALLATIARGVAVVRLGAIVSEIVRPGNEDEVLTLLGQGLLENNAKDIRTELLTGRLQPDEKAAAVALAKQVFDGPVDAHGAFQLMARACDRFVLVATGAPLAALQASALPTLVKESPQRAMVLLQGSVRALELCAFAARDNAWLLRRQHLLGDR